MDVHIVYIICHFLIPKLHIINQIKYLLILHMSHYINMIRINLFLIVLKNKY